MQDESAINGAAVTGQPGSGTGALDDAPSDLALDKAEGAEGASPKVPSKDGETSGELRRQYQELQRKLGEQGQALGDLRKERDQFAFTLQQIQAQQQANAQQRQQQQRQPGPAFPKVAPNEFFEDPDKAVEMKLAMRDQAYAKQMANMYKTIQMDNAVNASKYAFAEAKRNYPAAFDGVDGADVENVIADGIRTGKITDPQILSNPDTYAFTAMAIKSKKSNFGNNVVRPVSPMASELPGNGGRRMPSSDVDGVDLSPMNEDMRKGLRLAGYDPEKVLTKTKERIAAERKAKG
jgi:hypothetical protein